jgi:hypothetical protein
MTDIFPLAELPEDDIVRLLRLSLNDILRLCLVSRQFNNIYSCVVYAEVTLNRDSRPGRRLYRFATIIAKMTSPGAVGEETTNYRELELGQGSYRTDNWPDRILRQIKCGQN